MAEETDPDDEIPVPVRDAQVALRLVEQLAAAMDRDPTIAQKLDGTLRGLTPDSTLWLPEVGPVHDSESLRLHLDRLSRRLRERVPTDRPALGPPPVAAPADADGLRIRRVSRSAALLDDDLARYAVGWLDILEADIDAYVSVLEGAQSERPMQRHLASNPILLVQHLGGGHGRWVVPQKRLGAEYVTDFVIGEKSSSGFEWQFVELQSPTARLFVPSSGRQSEQFDEGLRQISEWRRWLTDNLDYARRPCSRNGLGLVDVNPNDRGLLILGREHELSDLDRERRRQLATTYDIDIRTYDWLVREAAARHEELRRSGRAAKSD